VIRNRDGNKTEFNILKDVIYVVMYVPHNLAGTKTHICKRESA
jgi:hypothetical protein